MSESTDKPRYRIPNADPDSGKKRIQIWTIQGRCYVQNVSDAERKRVRESLPRLMQQRRDTFLRLGIDAVRTSQIAAALGIYDDDKQDTEEEASQGQGNQAEAHNSSE